jgi:DtxR family transcriptional regulator, Mn-dependent transcriptional regulator
MRQRTPEQHELSPAAEDFLKAVFKLGRRSDRVSTNALADELAIAAPSATGMIKRLAALGLLEHERYRGVTLTLAGRRAALEVVRHHRLLEAYLVERLGFELDAAHAEACRLEHVLSETLEARIAELLDHPSHDPHGDPIPTADLRLDDPLGETLADLAAQEQCSVARIPDSDADLVRYFQQIGIVPGASLTVTDVAPFDGPVSILSGNSTVALSREIAGVVGVRRI